MSITVTPSAAAEVKNIVTAQQLGDDTVLRLTILGGGCSGMQYSLGFDSTFDPEVDTRYEYDGVCLVTQKKYDLHLEGTTIDFMDGVNGRGFAIDNPTFPKTGCAGCCH
jgi:iron-sulfur cluster assembly protein